jgi:hypothetical protein
MIQGVHAETVVFVDFNRATELVRAAGWPWLGRPGAMSTREVDLGEGVARRFRVRNGQLRVIEGKQITCSIQLERPDSPMQTLVRAQLTVTPVPRERRTRLALQGGAAPDLFQGVPASTNAFLRVANGYARSLLQSVASAMEGGNHPPRRGPLGTPAAYHRLAVDLRQRQRLSGSRPSNT